MRLWDNIIPNGGISTDGMPASETLCNYNPPTDDNSVINGGEWVRFETSDAGFYPNAAQVEQILSNSERYAGWSRAKVNPTE